MSGASRSEPETRASAFHRLTSQHLDASYRLARAIVHDPSDAEDATQDALVRAWRKWPSLRDQSLFEHWFTHKDEPLEQGRAGDHFVKCRRCGRELNVSQEYRPPPRMDFGPPDV